MTNKENQLNQLIHWKKYSKSAIKVLKKDIVMAKISTLIISHYMETSDHGKKKNISLLLLFVIITVIELLKDVSRFLHEFDKLCRWPDSIFQYSSYLIDDQCHIDNYHLSIITLWSKDA